MSAAPARAKVAPRRTAAPKSRKITVDIPQSLLDAAAEMIPDRRLTTSALVREAMEYFLKEKQARRLEQELEEGYLATAALSERVHREYEIVDAES